MNGNSACPRSELFGKSPSIYTAVFFKTYPLGGVSSPAILVVTLHSLLPATHANDYLMITPPESTYAR